MKSFDYVALSAEGKKQSGKINAPSARQARELLRAQKLALLDIQPSAAKAKSGSAASFLGRIKLADRARAARTMATLLSSGIPAEEVLRMTAPLFDGTPLQDRLARSRILLTEGARLSAALEQTEALRDLDIAMITAGENGGFLPDVMDRLADDLEAEDSIRKKVIGAMIYPVVLTLVAIAVLTVLMVVVVPKVVEQFTAFGEDLPPLTRGVIALAEFLSAYGLLVLGGIIALIAAYILALRVPAFVRAKDRLKLRLPVIGKLTAHIQAGRFARTMSGLLQAGTPGVSALQTAQHTVTNLVLRDEVIVATRRVREGGDLYSAFDQNSAFPRVFLQMIAAGERSGKLGEMFEKSGEYLDREVDGRISILLSLMEPLIIITLALFVLLIIGAIFLPILKLVTLV